MSAGGIDDGLAGDLALLRPHARDTPALERDARDPAAGPEPHALGAGGMLVGRHQVGRLEIAVRRAPQDRRSRTEIEPRPEPLGCPRVQKLGVEPGLGGDRPHPAELLRPLRGLRDPQAARLAPARLDLGLPLQPGEGGHRPHRQPCPLQRAADLTHQPGGLRAGDAAQGGLAFQQEHVRDPGFGQLVRDAGADGTAANDNDARLIDGHTFTRAMLGS